MHIGIYLYIKPLVLLVVVSREASLQHLLIVSKQLICMYTYVCVCVNLNVEIIDKSTHRYIDPFLQRTPFWCGFAGSGIPDLARMAATRSRCNNGSG